MGSLIANRAKYHHGPSLKTRNQIAEPGRLVLQSGILNRRPLNEGDAFSRRLPQADYFGSLSSAAASSSTFLAAAFFFGSALGVSSFISSSAFGTAFVDSVVALGC
jgi:hypothetical protein